MHRSPDLDTAGPNTPDAAGPDASAPECRQRCEVRLHECTLAGTTRKEDCRREWRYCVYDCFCR